MLTVLVISWFATCCTYRLENPQLQIHRHCRRTIYVNVAWCKQLWVRGWLTELTPQIVRHNQNHRAAATSISFNVLDLMHGDDFITLHLCRKSNAPVYISHLFCITHFTTGERLQKQSGERLQKLHYKKKKELSNMPSNATNKSPADTIWSEVFWRREAQRDATLDGL